MKNAALHLIVPGLLGPWSALRNEGRGGEPLPSLERLLARAEISDCSGDDFQLIARIVGVDEAFVGPISAAGDELEVGEACWFCADPVNLVADIHTVLLTDPRTLEISPTDRSALLHEIRESGALQDMNLEESRSGRWYLALDVLPDVSTTPPYPAIGKDVAAWMPRGPWASEWMSRLTELQMVLHASEINRFRETAGALPVNSLWVWGNGPWPPSRVGKVRDIFGDGPFVRGLGLLSGARIRPLPGHWEELRTAWSASAPAVALLDCLRIPAHLDDAAEAIALGLSLERDWFAPMARDVARSADLEIALYPGDGRRFRIDRGTSRRFWRRAKSGLISPR